MGSGDCRRCSVTAVAWSTSELCELMLSKPIVHRMRLQRLGDRGWKDRRPFVAEMARDASVGDTDFGDPNLSDAGAELVRFFDFTVVAEQFRKRSLIGSPVGAEFTPKADRH